MRIMQLLGSSAGGVSQHVAQVARLLDDAPGLEVIVASPGNLAEKFSPITQHRTVEITDRPSLGDARVLGRIKQLVADVDVVHAHGLRAGAMAGIALGAMARSHRPKLVVTLHNLPVGSFKVQSVTQVLERIVALRADAVLGVSSDLVDRMRAKRAKVHGRALVPAPTLREPHRTRDQTRRQLLGESAAQTKLVLTVARLAPQKGLDTAIEASVLLNAAGVEHLWVVAGDGPLASGLEERAAQAGAAVRFLGRRTDIPELLNAADVVVNAAVWEGQPVAVQEALRAGAAIVATDVGGTRETAGDAALYVQASNAEAMKVAVEQVLTVDQVKTGLQKRATTRSQQLPTESEVLESLTTLYQGL
jgi:glycosyltransferase involved in cell wall biosynthesis